MEPGSVAELIGAIASIVGVLVSVWALKTANSAQKSANENALALQQSRMELQRAQYERELLRDRQQIASQIQAWWAIKNGKIWGIFLANANQGSVVHEVTVHMEGSHAGDLKLASLPPGKYFCESKKDAHWDLPKYVSSDDSFAPVSAGKSHTVLSIEFEDVLGQKWKWEKERGVQIISTNE